MKRSDSRPRHTRRDDSVDVVVVGAGFAGLYMLHRLRQSGFSALVLEQAGGVGGTWYWNRYPGARCDIESMQYSFQFDPALEQEWEWTERYAAQPEILRYADHVADRYDLRGDIRFGARVVAAAFDEATGCWRLRTATGRRVRARYCIMATGCLSAPNTPRFDGLDSFAGRVTTPAPGPTSRSTSVDNGSASSAPARPPSSRFRSSPGRQSTCTSSSARRTTWCPRTTVLSTPPSRPGSRSVTRRFGPARRRPRNGVDHSPNPAAAVETAEEERLAEFESRWAIGGLGFLGAFSDLLVGHEANAMAAEYVRSKIRRKVKDPEVARLLTPHSTFGCKRLCVDIDYFETFNRPNVTLVDVYRSPIDRIVPEGLVAGGDVHASTPWSSPPASTR